jgi:hypothetical protein
MTEHLSACVGVTTSLAPNTLGLLHFVLILPFRAVDTRRSSRLAERSEVARLWPNGTGWAGEARRTTRTIMNPSSFFRKTGRAFRALPTVNALSPLKIFPRETIGNVYAEIFWDDATDREAQNVRSRPSSYTKPSEIYHANAARDFLSWAARKTLRVHGVLWWPVPIIVGRARTVMF